MLCSIFNSILCLEDQTGVNLESQKEYTLKESKLFFPDNTSKGPDGSSVKVHPPFHKGHPLHVLLLCKESIFGLLPKCRSTNQMDVWKRGNCQAGYLKNVFGDQNSLSLKYRTICNVWMNYIWALQICVLFLAVLKLCLKGHPERLLCLHFLASVGSVGKCQALEQEFFESTYLIQLSAYLHCPDRNQLIHSYCFLLLQMNQGV